MSLSGHPQTEPGSRPPLQWPDFEKVDMRVGVVTDAREFPEARRPAYRFWIDFGSLGVKRSSVQITHHYRPADLIGRLVIAAVNFPSKQIGPFVSEVLVLGAYNDAGEVIPALGACGTFTTKPRTMR